MGSTLEHLLAEGVISEVLARLQGGKEAEVYVVRYGGRAVAAKVYKDREVRSFKNNASYKEGRSVRNSRSQRAIDRGSKFGKAAAEDAWKSAEADALYKLHAAEVRVPTPVLFIDGVLLMELVLDAEGNAARRVIDTDLSVDQANTAYYDMLKQLVRMLACDLIHGDLSPYNVLWGAEGPVVIDFPQIISASHSSNSERFFLRDAENILGHFGRIDRRLDARRGDPSEIWRAYVRRELTPDFVPTGRVRPPPPPANPFAGSHHARPQNSRPQGGGSQPGRPQSGGSRHGRPQGGGPPSSQGRQQRRSDGPSRAPDSPQPIQPPHRPLGPQRGNESAPQHRPNAPPRPQSQRSGGQRRPAMAPEVIVRPRRALPPQAEAPSPPPVSSPNPPRDRPVASAGSDRPEAPLRRRRR